MPFRVLEPTSNFSKDRSEPRPLTLHELWIGQVLAGTIESCAARKHSLRVVDKAGKDKEIGRIELGENCLLSDALNM